MHDELWAGVDLKLENAFFHLNEMDRALQLPERTHYSVALQASGAIVGKDWQRHRSTPIWTPSSQQLEASGRLSSVGSGQTRISD
jgi:hypothetical protein